MIISLRGTSGAGKSHLARRVMDGYARSRPVHVIGRQKPQYTIFTDKGRPPLAVLGHYEIKNGGVDTLPHLGAAYLLAVDLYPMYHVLMEGKNMSDGVTHAFDLRDKHDVRIVYINTKIEDCINSVRQRGHNIAERSIIRTHRKVQRDIKRFSEIGMSVFQGDRDECFHYVRDLLCTSLS